MTTLTQREYDEIELREIERKLRDVEDPGRQVLPSSAGQEYRRKLREDIEHLQTRLSVEGEV